MLVERPAFFGRRDENFEFGRWRLRFRGRAPDFNAPYVAILGGEETFAAGLSRPYPEIVRDDIAIGVANFAQTAAGPDLWHKDDDLRRACNNAAAVVIVATGLQNLSNRFYRVHPRRNDRFLDASASLRTLYREVDFTRFHFTGHLLSALNKVDAERFGLVAAELRTAWTARLRSLVEGFTGPALLLYAASGPMPENRLRRLPPGPVAGNLLVWRGVIEDLRAHMNAVIEVDTGAPTRGRDHAHQAIAAALCGPLGQALRQKKSPPRVRRA